MLRVETCAPSNGRPEGSAIGPGGRLDLASSSRATLGRRRAFSRYISRLGPVGGFSPSPVVPSQTSQLLFHLWLSSFCFLFFHFSFVSFLPGLFRCCQFQYANVCRRAAVSEVQWSLIAIWRICHLVSALFALLAVIWLCVPSAEWREHWKPDELLRG